MATASPLSSSTSIHSKMKFFQKGHSLSNSKSLTFTRRKYQTVVKASRVDKFSKSDIIVSPSILSANFSKLGEQVKAVEVAGCDWIHVDVMDGRFVPNITIGPLVVDALRPITDLPLDVHLMIVEPEQRVPDFIKAGADIVSVHCEQSSSIHLHRTVNQIKSLGAKAGVVLNPATPLSTIEYVLDVVDLVLIMSVNPGFGGQSFIESQVKKISDLRRMCVEKAVNPWIEVDGGVTPKNAYKVIEAGANALVAGSAVFGAPDYAEAIKGIKASKRPKPAAEKISNSSFVLFFAAMMHGRRLFSMLFMIVVAIILPSPEAQRTPCSPVHNVLDYGAVGDDHHDDTQAFLEAWKATCDCSSSRATMMIVPSRKTFIINSLAFEGPCKSPYVNVEINGIIVAPKNPSNWRCNDNCETWIEFRGVNGLSIHGTGTIDGRGQLWWNSQESKGPNALRISDSSNIRLSGLNFINNPRMHVVLNGLQSANVTYLHINSPENSPNTDGIHVAKSEYVYIAHSTIQTGDDCISIVNGASHVEVNDIRCGPGHGISIGSLGKDGVQDRVEYIHVSDVLFNRSENGARIKTWQGGRGYAKHITFERISLIEADNPIIIDQFYCDNEMCSKYSNHKDAVKISDVTFSHVVGTSKGKTACTRPDTRNKCSSNLLPIMIYRLVGTEQIEKEQILVPTNPNCQFVIVAISRFS
ncbi:hypothetical protein Leryth_013103 [Lithospermum erythrorhizon]|nr:hypothetical protein Leryth_013103 [Lithospermum erythrorhizon]